MGKRLLREGCKIIAEANTRHRLAGDITGRWRLAEPAGGQQIEGGGFMGLLMARTAS